MLFVLFLPKGIWGTLLDTLVSERRGMSAPLLAVEGIGKRFGGFVALEEHDDRISAGTAHLDHRPERRRQEHVLQRPVRRADAVERTMRFKGRDLKGLPQHGFVHRGIARSYQITNIFPDLTVHENVRVAAQALTVPLQHLA